MEDTPLKDALLNLQDAAYHPGIDMFDAFYDFQWAYQDALGALDLADYDGVRRSVLYAIVELVELLNETPWKWHKMEGFEINEDTFAEEWADVMCFVFNLPIYAGIDAQSLKNALARTVAKNYTRWENGTNGRRV